jgi:hypothetical protein
MDIFNQEKILKKGELKQEDIPNILVADEIGFKPSVGENTQDWVIKNGTSPKFLFEEIGTTTVMITVGIINTENKIKSFCHYYIIKKTKNENYEIHTSDDEKVLVTSEEVKGMTSNLLKQWIYEVKKSIESNLFILLWDNLKAHHNDEVHRYLQESNICVITYPPYTAKYLSILDNTIFGWLKTELSNEAKKIQVKYPMKILFTPGYKTKSKSFFKK